MMNINTKVRVVRRGTLPFLYSGVIGLKSTNKIFSQNYIYQFFMHLSNVATILRTCFFISS
jgi:hypothetical protein